MQESTFTNYDQLPLFLNANTVAKVLGVSISSAYELIQEDSAYLQSEYPQLL